MKWLWRIPALLISLALVGVIVFVFFMGPPGPPPFVEKAPDPNGRPNILLMLAEDLSPRIGAFGDAQARTPHIDAMARAGVRYPNTFTTSGVCAPSRAASVTGVHQGSIGAQHMRTSNRNYLAVPPTKLKAFPELLRKQGYYTYTNSKLDYQFSGVRNGTGPFTIWDDEGDGASWRNRGDGQPFFARTNFFVTHESGVFSPLGTWPRSPLHLAVQLYRHHRYGTFTQAEKVDPDSLILPPYYPDVPEVRGDLALHYANIHRLDRLVGELVERLKSDGLADDTIIIFTTDHGDGLPRHKRSLFDTGIKVPMIIVWPEKFRPAGVEPGTLDKRMVSFVDLAPTILRLAGVEVPDYVQGYDFVEGPRHRYVFAAADRVDEITDKQRAVRDERFKYILSHRPDLPGGHKSEFRDHLASIRAMRKLYEEGKLPPHQAQYFEGPGVEQLYDLEADPSELNNLIDDPAYKPVADRLRGALSDWVARMGPQMDRPEDELIASILDENGEIRTTPAPQIRAQDGTITITARENASIGYRWDDGDWQIYSGPLTPVEGATLEAKAVRYGWHESGVVTLP